MKVLNFINAKGKTVRVREEGATVSVDAEGRYFTVELSREGDLVGVSVAESVILFVTVQEGVLAYSYTGHLLFRLADYAKEGLSPVVSGTVMTPFEALTFLARVPGAPLAKEHSYYYCNCENGEAFLIDLFDGELVYHKTLPQ